MSRKEKQIELEVVETPQHQNLVQIKGQTVGKIVANADKFDCYVGDQVFHEKNEADALQQVIREYNLHQR
ncbi:DUF2969 family protein [Fructilactobacillus carniphilus]|uniref:DUF2969 domain-containing protein n=1 Tax=Fructilactobacillus carniphilus TaxID=2940297 RepID=A0ABY5BZQ6_9LACO|nr:DUF2969 family protein [Fructilactobacillus carniphilus]USS91274.1 DUF2969 domain-containing protein [Fructilactobacillus carniphilus]